MLEVEMCDWVGVIENRLWRIFKAHFDDYVLLF